MPDAPDTTTETPPAPEQEATETPATAEPETSIEDLVNDESADLSALPDKTQDEIKKLRRESAKYRQTAQSWEQATSGYHPDDIATIQQALAAGRENPQEVGKWMLEQAKSLLGDEFPEAQPEPVSENTTPDENGMFTEEQVRKIVEDAVSAKFSERDQQTQTQQRVEQIKSETEKLGFGPSHPLHHALLSTARFQTDGDLAKAAELLKQTVGEDNNSETDVQDPQPGAGGQSQPGAGHTPVPTSGGTPAGTRQVRDPKAAMRERLAKQLGSARGFNEPLV